MTISSLKISFLLLLGGFLGLNTLQAQSTQFGFLEDTIAIQASALEVEPIVYSKIINKTNANIEIRWRRTTLCIGSQNTTQVCDLNVCHATQVSTQKFTLPANDTGEISVHLLNPNTVVPRMVVRLDYWDVNTPSPDTVRTYYIVNTCVSSTNEPLPAAIAKVSPNPVKNTLGLGNDTDVANIQLFDLNGRLIRTFTHQTGQRHPVGDLQEGTYAVVLQDRFGRIFQAIQIQKSSE
jgi:hypothetical protein